MNAGESVPPRANPADKPLAPNLPACEAARRLFYRHYRILLANREGALKASTSEPLHDLRIAIRRMRTVLRAFRKPLEESSAPRLEADLRRLNRSLGSARDLDVWIEFLTSEPVKAQLEGHRLWARFVAHQQELRRMQQITVRRHLSGAGFAALRKRIDRFLEEELPGASGAAAMAPVAELARRVIKKSLRSALKKGHFRHAQSPDKLHRLRIALRRLRYLIAFFEEILGDPIRKLGKRAHAVERALGEMRDADLALQRILTEGPTPPRVLVRRLTRRRQSMAAEVESAWRRLHDAELMVSVDRILNG